MNRRTTLRLTGLALPFLLAAAVPQIVRAQSNPLIGTWKLNLAKSKYTQGPAPRSTTLTFSGEGDNLIDTVETVDAQGQAAKFVLRHVYDGKPHPPTGAAGDAYDASAYTRIDALTVNFVRSKGGKAVQTGSAVLSQDGKTYTVTTEGTGVNGQPVSSVAVYEKQ